MPILAYFGIKASDLTTWSKVGETFVQAISNPLKDLKIPTAIDILNENNKL